MTEQPFDPDAASTHDGIFGLPFGADESRVVLIGVPFDATTSYRCGAAEGPAAILEASRQVDLHDAQTGDPWRAGIFLEPISDEIRLLNAVARDRAAPIKERGGAQPGDPGLDVVNDAGETVADWLRVRCDAWLDAGKLVGVVGGDHASPLGAMMALAARHTGMGILHIDAHADLRVAFEGFEYSHASIMHNALTRVPSIQRLVQVGLRDVGSAEMAAVAASAGRVRTFFDHEIASTLFAGGTFAAVCDRILEALPEDVYVSFDIDGLEPSLCPGTGTPVPGGLTFQQACYLLERLARSKRRIVGFDLCEVAPGGKADGIDAITGARLLYKLVGFMLVSQGG